MSRKLLYIFGFLIFIIGVVPLFVDLSDYAAPYLIDAQKTVGRSIKTGSIRLQILPTPRLKINDVVLGNAPNSETPDMLKIKSVEVILSLTDLLKGKVVVKSVGINSPEVNLEKFKNNDANWNLKIAQKPNENEQDTASTVNSAASGFLVKNLSITNALVHYVDHNTGTTKSFSNLNIESATDELFGPYKIHIRCEAGEDRIDVEMLTGVINLNDKTTLQANVSLNHNEQKINAKLNGFVDIAQQQFGAHFTASSVDMPLIIELPHQKIDLHKTIDVKGEIYASPNKVDIKNLNINHPIGCLIGMLSYNLANSTFSTDLKFKHLEDSVSIKCNTQNFEEFDYSITSANYQEILKWVSKDQNINGAIDIKGTFETKDGSLIFDKTTLKLGDASADASIKFNTLTKGLAMSGKLQSVQKWGKILGQDLPFSGGATINFALTPDKDGSKIATKVSLSNGNIAFAGQLGTGELIAKGNLTLDHFNFNDMIINLKSDIQIKSKEINLGIQNINLKAKSGLNLSAGGKILVDLTKEKPHIVGAITAQPIQLTAYQNDQISLVKTLYDPEVFHYKLLQIVSNANSRWSAEQINLPLSAFNMDLKIAVPKITISGLVFEGLQSDIALINGKLSIPFLAQMYGGKLNGALLITGSEPKVSLSVKFDNIAIDKIPAAAAHFRQGKASGLMELQTQGKSQYDFVSKLQGQTQFAIADGIVKGFDLHEIVGALKKPKNLLDFKILQNGFSGKGETAFSKAGGKFIIKNGVANTNDLTINTADASLKIEGYADILNWQMRFNGEIVVPGIKDLPPLKFIIKGSIDQPSYNLDLKQLQQLFMQKGAGELVSKALGNAIPGLDKIIPGLGKKSKNAASPENPEASNSNQPAADKPVKVDQVVKGLMKGIFG